MKSAENLSIMVALGGGLLSFLSPCVLPLLPSYLSFITGMSLDELKDPLLISKVRGKVILNSLLFVLGFSTVFVVLGTSFSFVGRFFAVHQQIIQKIAGVMIIFFGLYIVGIFNIPYLMRTKEIITLKNRPAGYIGSVLVGIAFGSTWTPCIGPILGAILTLAGTSKGINQGTTLLMAYSAGLAIPFILTSLAVGHFLSIFRKFRKILHMVYISGGIFLILVGILILTGYFYAINSFFTGLIPLWLLERI